MIDRKKYGTWRLSEYILRGYWSRDVKVHLKRYKAR